MIAALYVMADGIYSGRSDVACWYEARDARKYAGPWPVVAHPPCARWGKYWSGGPSAPVRRLLGDDAGCFSAALASVREFGGVLEHPAASRAWMKFSILAPPSSGGWVVADGDGGWTCCIEQGNYGHQARKATWLYAVGVDLPSLRWGMAKGGIKPLEDMSRRQRNATPPEFAELLLSIARTARMPATKGDK